MESIDITPTTDGYQAIAARFAVQILTDAKAARRPDTTAILRTYTELVGYLAANHPQHYAALLTYIGKF